jgi:hypothetical protein
MATRLAYTRAVRHVKTVATAAVAVMITQALLAQNRLKPTVPGTAGDPMWQAVVRTSDKRTFLTDGGLAIDAALAKPAALPEREVSGKVLETYFTAAHSAECGLGDLKRTASGKTYTTPDGIPLNATYIEYLRRILPRGQVRLRMSGDMHPVVIVADARVLGVLMPVKK